MKWPFVSTKRYERDLGAANSISKTLAEMVDREYKRARSDVQAQVHQWATDQNYKQFHGGRVDFNTLATQFAPTPTTVAGIVEQAGIPPIGNGPSPWVRDLMGEIAADTRSITNG